MIAPRGYTPLAKIWDKISDADKDHFRRMFSDAEIPPGRSAWQMSPMDFCELTMFEAAQPKLTAWRGEGDPIQVGSDNLISSVWEHLPSNADLMETMLDGKSLREVMPLEIARRAKLYGPDGPTKDGHHVLPLFWDRTSYSLSLEMFGWLSEQTRKIETTWEAAGAPAEAQPEEWLAKPALDRITVTVSSLRKLGADAAPLVLEDSWVPEFRKRWKARLKKVNLNGAQTSERSKGPGRPHHEGVAETYWKLFPHGDKAAGVSNYQKAADCIAKHLKLVSLSERTLRDHLNAFKQKKSGNN